MEDYSHYRNDILERVKVDPETGCWNWSKSTFESGYGQIKRKGKNWRSHRLSYLAFVGTIEEDLLVCHKCNNKLCCNPDHLYAGSSKDNAKDSIEAGTSYFHNIDQRAELNHSSVLNNKDIENIKSMILSGKYTQDQIASHYNVSRRVIGRMLDSTTGYNESPLTVHNHNQIFLGKRLTKYGHKTIFDLHFQGKTVTDIANIISKSSTFVRRVISGDRHPKWFKIHNK